SIKGSMQQAEKLSGRRLSPQKINWDAGQHDDESGPCRGRLVNEKNSEDRARADDVESGHDRITECFIRTLSFGSFPAQHEDADDCQNVEDERGRNDVCEQIIVERTKASIFIDRARQDEQR